MTINTIHTFSNLLLPVRGSTNGFCTQAWFVQSRTNLSRHAYLQRLLSAHSWSPLCSHYIQLLGLVLSLPLTVADLTNLPMIKRNSVYFVTLFLVVLSEHFLLLLWKKPSLWNKVSCLRVMPCTGLESLSRWGTMSHACTMCLFTQLGESLKDKRKWWRETVLDLRWREQLRHPPPNVLQMRIGMCLSPSFPVTHL